MKTIITNIKKYIPTNWPLQSFIAVNPLFDLTNEPIDSALLTISRYTSIKGTLNLQEYHQYYRVGKISFANIDFAVEEFFSDKQIGKELKNDLVTLLTNPIFQEKLENTDQSRVDFSVNLFARRASLYGENYDKVRKQVISFCNDFFDLGQAKWKMPLKEDRLFPAWLKYTQIENSAFKKILKNISSDPIDALSELLVKLGVPLTNWHDYLATVAFQMLGWASFLKWLESRPDNPYFSKRGSLEELLAIWLCYELSLKVKYGISYEEIEIVNNNKISSLLIDNYITEDIASQINIFHLGLIWQRAYEHSYQEQLLSQINSTSKISEEISRANAQAVFCIDTRSEGFRRHFESMGNYQTFGFAGFFGVGFKLLDEHTHSCSLQCPAIVVPEKTLINKSVNNSFIANSSQIFQTAINRAKSGFFSPFILFDAVGAWFSTVLLGKTFFPSFIYQYLRSLKNRFKHEPEYSEKTLNMFANNGGFSHEEITDSLAFVFRAIGLTTNFAKFIIIAGHKAESQNNPFQSSLDCGACGGNGGIPNAIAFCQAANDKQVRKLLSTKFSITIPDDTVFVSSCHFTTTDEFEYYNLDTLDKMQLAEFEKIQSDINIACNLLRFERAKLLDNDDLITRKTNWAELIPEIALANNAAFIIAPRHITANFHLQRRTFLHSYDPSNDPDGKILSFILNAPVLVGHWINSQYYFSSTDHSIYGSGNKAIHNVIGGFGVMEGNFSDFKIGLPTQSLTCLDTRVHEPLRLLVVIYANRKLVKKLLDQSPAVANIFNGRWAHLVIIDPDEYGFKISLSSQNS